MQPKQTRKKLTVLLFALFAFSILSIAQPATAAKKYSAAALKEDLAFVKQQIFAVHANPFTELTRQQYENLFKEIDVKITDSLTAVDFYKLAKPAMGFLSDEHADISLLKPLQLFTENDMLPPFTLKKDGKKYIIEAVVEPATGIGIGMAIKQINHVPVETLVNQCTTYATGFPQQRMDKALHYFGYFYGFGNTPAGTYNLTMDDGKTVTVNGVTAAAWLKHMYGNNTGKSRCDKMVSYTRYGKTGYINACSFSTHTDSEFNVMADSIRSIYRQIKGDGIETLVIDVSDNGGGNSAVGEVLIEGFYSRPYRSYQCNWKRSDEYLKLIKSWGINDDQYTRKKPGDIIHFDADTIWPKDNADRFNGKVYVVIGDGTFSSAIMFATLINDNNMATLIGQTPRDGHPTHFGELYSTTIPNTKLPMRFGVKEWIRPAGKDKDNTLKPAIVMPVTVPLNVENIISRVNRLQPGK